MTVRRRLLAFAFLVAACSGSGAFYFDGYCWTPLKDQPECQDVVWIQKAPLVVPNYCGVTQDGHAYLGCGLAGNCVVVSMYDAETAHQVFLSGHSQSHWAHERKHKLEQLGHPKRTVNGC